MQFNDRLDRDWRSLERNIRDPHVAVGWSSTRWQSICQLFNYIASPRDRYLSKQLERNIPRSTWRQRSIPFTLSRERSIIYTDYFIHIVTPAVHCELDCPYRYLPQLARISPQAGRDDRCVRGVRPPGELLGLRAAPAPVRRRQAP